MSSKEDTLSLFEDSALCRLNCSRAPGDFTNKDRQSSGVDRIRSGARCRRIPIHGAAPRQRYTRRLWCWHPAELSRIPPIPRCSRITCPCARTASHGSSTRAAGTLPRHRCNHREPDRVRQSSLVSQPLPLVLRPTRIVHRPSPIVFGPTRPRTRPTRLRSRLPLPEKSQPLHSIRLVRRVVSGNRRGMIYASACLAGLQSASLGHTQSFFTCAVDAADRRG